MISSLYVPMVFWVLLMNSCTQMFLLGCAGISVLQKFLGWVTSWQFSLIWCYIVFSAKKEEQKLKKKFWDIFQTVMWTFNASKFCYFIPFKKTPTTSRRCPLFSRKALLFLFLPSLHNHIAGISMPTANAAAVIWQVHIKQSYKMKHIIFVKPQWIHGQCFMLYMANIFWWETKSVKKAMHF